MVQPGPLAYRASKPHGQPVTYAYDYTSFNYFSSVCVCVSLNSIIQLAINSRCYKTAKHITRGALIRLQMYVMTFFLYTILS